MARKDFQTAVRNYFTNFLIACCRNAIENGMLPDLTKSVSGNAGYSICPIIYHFIFAYFQ
jgi:hypothetical protein